MDYNPQLPLHRRLLALAISDFLESTGLPLAGEKRKDGTVPSSLQSTLAEKGFHIARGSLGKIADVHNAADTTAPFGSERVAAILATLGYWPPLHNAEQALRRLPAFAGAIDSPAVRTMQEVEGRYVSYQYSSRKPGNILIGEATIGPLLPYGGASAQNFIRKTGSSANSTLYAGIAWADNLGNIYMLLRALPALSPTFVVLDETERPGAHSDIETINGTAIGAARQYNRHLTALSLHRAAYPDNDTPIEPDQHDRLPEAVRNYILLPLKNGPSNY